MPISKSLFSQGEWVVHAVYGVGQILGQERKVIEGDEVEYYWIRTDSSDYWLPVEKTDIDHVRPLASLNQFRKALLLLQDEPNSLAKDYYQRRKEVIIALNTTSLEIKACMIRDLSRRKRDKGLNPDEGNALLKMMTNFTTEWALVSGEERKALDGKLLKALQPGRKKFVEA